jgi:hypothetical protein
VDARPWLPLFDQVLYLTFALFFTEITQARLLKPMQVVQDGLGESQVRPHFQSPVLQKELPCRATLTVNDAAQSENGFEPDFRIAQRECPLGRRMAVLGCRLRISKIPRAKLASHSLRRPNRECTLKGTSAAGGWIDGQQTTFSCHLEGNFEDISTV